MTDKEYSSMIKSVSPASKSLKNCFNAFWVGGVICVIGQALSDFYTNYCQMEQQAASAFVSITLVALSIILTAFGLYQKIAKFAGAGTLVPITGFANAMSSPSIEFKPEGHIMGIGAKIFSIAGPVIVFGLFADFLYGIALYIMSLF